MTAVVAMTEVRVRYSAKIDPALAKTDHLLDWWAKFDRGKRSLHPLEVIQLMHDGAVLGGWDGEPADIATCDEVVASSPAETRAFIDLWYKDRSPVYLKCNRLGISRTTIYAELKGHLNYIKGRLHGKGVDV